MTETLFEVPAAAPATMHKEASLSPCGAYRYYLARTWSTSDPDGSERRVTFVMLNPSTADADLDDPTIRRCIGFARSWGYDGLDVVNLYAYRATQPADMLAAADPVGPENDEWLRRAASYAAARREPIIAAWGNNADPARVAQVAALPGMGQLHALGVTLSGAPKHPLARGHHRIPDDAQPTPWRLP